MNKLMLEKNYEKVVELFESYITNFKKTKDGQNKFIFPHDQFILVTIALFSMVINL